MVVMKLAICAGHTTNAIKQKEIILKRWEMWCRNCGATYYHNSPTITACPGLDCGAQYMELVAVIEISEIAPFQGYPTREKLDKSSRK
jgi:Zn finger protein HypA/HybF involved in hydrogenase expression